MSGEKNHSVKTSKVMKCSKVRIFGSDTDKSKLNAWRIKRRLNSGTRGVMRVRIKRRVKYCNIGRAETCLTAEGAVSFLRRTLVHTIVTVCLKLWVTDRCPSAKFFNSLRKLHEIGHYFRSIKCEEMSVFVKI